MPKKKDYSVKKQAIAGPWKRMSALDRAIITGTTLPSKNKNPGRYLDK